MIRVCFDKFHRVDRAWYYILQRLRSMFSLGILLGNDIWNRRQVRKYTCHYSHMAMKRTDFAFHSICLKRIKGILIFQFEIQMIFFHWIRAYQYIPERNCTRNLEVFSIDMSHRFGMVPSRMRCVLRFHTVKPWSQWGIGIGTMAQQMSSQLHRCLHFGILVLSSYGMDSNVHKIHQHNETCSCKGEKKRH